jgi:anti-sigma28 factor (negative regulator of flagellin synthesis)
MKIVEREALKTEKPQSEKVYETSKAASRRAKTAAEPSAPREDGIALNNQEQLLALATSVSSGGNSRVERLTELVQSGQYQVDPTALSGALIDAMLKGY